MLGRDREGGRGLSFFSLPVLPRLVKALRESSSEDADEADTDETGGCSAENLFKLVALGRKESGRPQRQHREEERQGQ